MRLDQLLVTLDEGDLYPVGLKLLDNINRPHFLLLSDDEEVADFEVDPDGTVSNFHPRPDSRVRTWTALMKVVNA